MFNLHDFVKKALTGMIGTRPDYKVREYALSWYDKGVLTDADLAELDLALDAQHAQPEEPAE